MSLRRRLLLLFALTVLLSVAAVTLIVSAMARRAFDRANDQSTAALVAQFRKEFDRKGEDVSRRVESIAASSDSNRMLVAAARPSPDYNGFLDTAQMIAEAQQLDFLEFADDQGKIISSAQWPAKFGYQEPAAKSTTPATPFLKEEELPAGSALGSFAVRAIAAGEHRLYVLGGVRLDRSFLASFSAPAGMRVMLYENFSKASDFSPGRLLTSGITVQDPGQLAPVIQQVQRDPREASAVIHWKSDGDEGVNAFPLFGADHQLLGILLVGSSRQIYVDLRGQIRSAALLAAGAGLLLAVVLSSWAAARVTRPVEQLARAAQEVAAGNWDAGLTASSAADANSPSKDEISALAGSFHQMTRDLLDQRERLVQSERVAAWRELARRLAHELKNPLFPLQLTIENLLRAREHSQQQFDETFRESAATLLAEISNLKNIVSRFSEFSRMPQPQFQPVKLNDLVTDVAKLHQAQLSQANITRDFQLAETSRDAIAADPDLLHRAVSNLVLNAIEAMPRGGNLTMRTRHASGVGYVEISDTGQGLSKEQCASLFTPYYTSKEHGTGLGLAIVQSIVSDHGGRISVNSEPGCGATFIIELPANRDKLQPAQETHV